MVYTFDNDTVSDLHKDAYGMRPGAGWWARWKGMDDAARQAEWDYLCNAAESEARQEREAQDRAATRWEAHITKMMADNGIDTFVINANGYVHYLARRSIYISTADFYNPAVA